MAEQVGGIYYETTLETKGLIAAERQVAKSLDRMGGEGDKLQARFSKMSAAISAALGAIAIEGLISKVVTAQRSFDVMFASLKTMTGGVDQASAAWERLVRFAATTPYTLEQSVNGFVKLKALGLDPGERAMTSYGNTAAAMGKDLTQMIEAVADASTGEFERLKEFGIKAKQEGDKVSLTFQGVTTTIANNAQAITDYLIRIGEVEFGGAMSERMKTLDGDISNLQDSLAALYLSISQSGFGEAIAEGVRKATEAIAEATASIKRGGLTDYFEGLVPYINAAEMAATTLAAVIAGHLLASFVAAAAQAYLAATAIGAATLAARGFAGVVALLGGPIGIAVTGLALLALNWDKVARGAKDAAEVSEDAARRIEKALKKGPSIATAELTTQLAEYQKELGTARQAVVNLKVGTYGKGDAKDIEKAQARVEALEGAINRVKTAMVEAYSPAPREATSLPPPEPPKKPAKGGAKKTGPAPFDGAAYVAGLAREAADEYQKIDIVQREALRKNDQLLAQKKITVEQHQQALTLIEQNASQDRAAIAQKQSEAAIARQIEYGAAEEANALKLAEQRKRGQQAALDMKVANDPVAQLQIELERKKELLALYAAEDQANERLYAEAAVTLEQQTQDRIRQIREKEMADRAAAQSAQLTAYGSLFGNMADIAKAFGGKQNGIYKALFAASKAFALADAAIKIQQGIAGAAALPFPANIPAIASVVAATASIISTISGVSYGGGRQYGGPVSAGSLYKVNETGRPEMFTGSNGSQYMLPTKSGAVTPADQVGGGGSQAWNIIIQNAPAGTSASVDDQSRTVLIAVGEVASQISNNSGPVWSALRGSSNVAPRQ